MGEKECPMDKLEKEKNLELLEEQNAEEEALKEVQDDELRTSIAEDFGLDVESEDDLAVLEKLISREKEYRSKLGGAIKQKRKWRERAEGKFDGEDANKKAGNKSTDGDPVDVDAKVNKILEERDLADLNLPDEIEEKVRLLSALNKVSVREASKDPIIVQMLENHKRDEEVKASIPRRNNKGSSIPSVDTSKPLDPSNFDFNTPEGVKAWKEAKEARKEHIRKNK